jgi:hypothetical protein
MKLLSDEFGGHLPTDPPHRLGVPALQKRWLNRVGEKLRRIGVWLDTPVVTSRSQTLALSCYLLFLLLGRLPHAYEPLRMVTLVAMLLLILRRGVKAL